MGNQSIGVSCVIDFSLKHIIVAAQVYFRRALNRNQAPLGEEKAPRSSRLLPLLAPLFPKRACSRAKREFRNKKTQFRLFFSLDSFGESRNPTWSLLKQIQGFFRPGFFTIWSCYAQVFLPSGVVTSRGLTSRSHTSRSLTIRGLTTTRSYIHRSYDQ